MTDEPEDPSPIAELIRNRPEAFDFADIPDITDVSKEHQEDLLRNAPPYMQALRNRFSED